MDIQKEREAFEQHLTDTGLVEFSGYGFAVDECDEYLHEPTQVAWDSWLIGLNRAKAQSEKKIKLLLCDEHLQKCESPTGFFNSQYPDEEPCLICLAKEAKANTVPEGFVLVEKTDLECAIDALKWASNEDSDLCAKQAAVLEGAIEAQEPAND